MPLPFQKPLYDVLGDMPTAAAILTEAAELWREVTVVAGDPKVDNLDTLDDLLGDPELPDPDFVNETLRSVRKHGTDLVTNAPHNYAKNIRGPSRQQTPPHGMPANLQAAAEDWRKTGRWLGGARGWP